MPELIRQRVAVARALGGSAFALGGVGCLVAWWVLPERALAVLARDDVFSVIWPLVPALLAAGLPSAFAFDGRDLERASGRPAHSLRGRSLLLLTVTSSAVVAASPYDSATVARCTMVLVGMGLVSLALLPRQVAWVPIALYPAACWLLGTRSGGDHAAWAVPLRPPDDPVAMRTAVAAAALGLVLFVVLGTRGDGD
ncbi:MAG: hypothetical protein KF906_02705 [Actinobacteria bacterium]|nr:hypothetical protein [Actinomycetota bacterium]